MPREDGTLRRGEAEQIANEPEDQEVHTQDVLTDASDPESTVTHSWVGDLEHSVVRFFKNGVWQEHHLTAEDVPEAAPEVAPEREPEPVDQLTLDVPAAPAAPATESID